jgi:hypothetical protein
MEQALGHGLPAAAARRARRTGRPGDDRLDVPAGRAGPLRVRDHLAARQAEANAFLAGMLVDRRGVVAHAATIAPPDAS